MFALILAIADAGNPGTAKTTSSGCFLASFGSNFEDDTISGAVWEGLESSNVSSVSGAGVIFDFFFFFLSDLSLAEGGGVEMVAGLPEKISSISDAVALALATIPTVVGLRLKVPI